MWARRKAHARFASNQATHATTPRPSARVSHVGSIEGIAPRSGAGGSRPLHLGAFAAHPLLNAVAIGGPVLSDVEAVDTVPVDNV